MPRRSSRRWRRRRGETSIGRVRLHVKAGEFASRTNRLGVSARVRVENRVPRADGPAGGGAAVFGGRRSCDRGRRGNAFMHRSNGFMVRARVSLEPRRRVPRVERPVVPLPWFEARLRRAPHHEALGGAAPMPSGGRGLFSVRTFVSERARRMERPGAHMRSIPAVSMRPRRSVTVRPAMRRSGAISAKGTSTKARSETKGCGSTRSVVTITSPS